MPNLPLFFRGNKKPEEETAEDQTKEQVKRSSLEKGKTDSEKKEPRKSDETTKGFTLKLAHHDEKATDKGDGKEIVKPKEDDALLYDPEDDVWALDEGRPSRGRKYAHSLMDAFRPIMLIGSLFGVFPLVAHRTHDGQYTCRFSWISYATILFLLFSTFTVGITFWFLISLITVTINTPEHPDFGNKTGDIYRSEEIYVYKRNVISLIVACCSLIHLAICIIAVFHRRDFIAKQLIYWTEVVELLHLDVGKDVAKVIWHQLILLAATGLFFVAVYFLNFIPGIAGSGSMLYIILTRTFDPLNVWHSNMYVKKMLCAAFFMYVIFAGYIYILWFFYYCRVLTNILKIWNNRFEFCLHKHVLEGTTAQQSRETKAGTREANRTSRRHLFQDHLVIFNLLEGVNTQFEVIMESYYLSTMIMIIFETYGFVRAFVYSEFLECGARQFDIVPISIFLAMQFYFYIRVTLEAAGVADEARHVLDIVRRKGMMTSRADNELWFMLSMRLSFGGHEDVGIIGAGFFYITKAFLLGGISAIMSHFIIFYQFEVPLAQTKQADSNLMRLNITALLEQLEGVAGTKC